MDEGYILCDQYGHVRQSRETTEALFVAIQELSPEPVGVLVRMNGQPTDRAARQLLATSAPVNAVAMVLSSKVGTMLLNFFMRTSEPHFPLRVFTDEEKARKWLLSTCETMQ
jgi:hypothetical protein